jgi:mRNA interferase RelE/StbE
LTYSIDWKPAAIDAVARLHKEDPTGVELVLLAVDDLLDNPWPTNSVELGHAGIYRLLLGYYRVTYAVSESTVTVAVLLVGKSPNAR